MEIRQNMIDLEGAVTIGTKLNTIKINPLKAWHDVIKFWILFINKVSFHFYLSYFHALYLVSTLTFIFYIVHDLRALGIALYNWFMGLGNSLKVVVHHLLIEGMVGFDYRDEFSMVGALVCIVTC